MLPPALQQFADARLRDGAVALQFLTGLQHSGLAAPDDAQLAALSSTALVAVTATLLLLLLAPRSRALLFQGVEAVVAMTLVVILCAVVLGLPLGIIYLVLRAAAFLLGLVLSIPTVANLLATLRSSLPF
ncbi:hypothetical protein ACK3TF_002651 [Chlorella vulgaris]